MSSITEAFNFIKKMIGNALEAAAEGIEVISDGIKEAADSAAAAMKDMGEDMVANMEAVANYIEEKGNQLLNSGLNTVLIGFCHCSRRLLDVVLTFAFRPCLMDTKLHVFTSSVPAGSDL